VTEERIGRWEYGWWLVAGKQNDCSAYPERRRETEVTRDGMALVGLEEWAGRERESLEERPGGMDEAGVELDESAAYSPCVHFSPPWPR
jgi:hypothetical protein